MCFGLLSLGLCLRLNHMSIDCLGTALFFISIVTSARQSSSLVHDEGCWSPPLPAGSEIWLLLTTPLSSWPCASPRSPLASKILTAKLFSFPVCSDLLTSRQSLCFVLWDYTIKHIYSASVSLVIWLYSVKLNRDVNCWEKKKRAVIHEGYFGEL